MNADDQISERESEYTGDEWSAAQPGHDELEDCPDPRCFVARSIPADPELLAAPRERLARRSSR